MTKFREKLKFIDLCVIAEYYLSYLVNANSTFQSVQRSCEKTEAVGTLIGHYFRMDRSKWNFGNCCLLIEKDFYVYWFMVHYNLYFVAITLGYAIYTVITKA